MMMNFGFCRHILTNFFVRLDEVLYTTHNYVLKHSCDTIINLPCGSAYKLTLILLSFNVVLEWFYNNNSIMSACRWVRATRAGWARAAAPPARGCGAPSRPPPQTSTGRRYTTNSLTTPSLWIMIWVSQLLPILFNNSKQRLVLSMMRLPIWGAIINYNYSSFKPVKKATYCPTFWHWLPPRWGGLNLNVF